MAMLKQLYHLAAAFVLLLLMGCQISIAHGREGKPSLLRGARSNEQPEQKLSNHRNLKKKTTTKDGKISVSRNMGMQMTMDTVAPKKRGLPRMSVAIPGKKGSLGMINTLVAKGNEQQIQKATEQELQKQQQQQQQQQLLVPTTTNNNNNNKRSSIQIKATSVEFDPKGHAHVRMIQSMHNMLIEGAALMVHLHPNGTLTAINGEFCVDENDLEDDLFMTVLQDDADHQLSDARTLLDMALHEANIAPEGGEWMGEPERTVVRRDFDGSACLAWKQSIRYNVSEGTKGDGPQLDWIYADATYILKEASTSDNDSDSNNMMMNNEAIPSIFEHLFQNDTDAHKFYVTTAPTNRVLCARHPQYMGSGIPNLRTYDCNGRTSFCSLESTSSAPINTGDQAVDAAHNGAIATYNYYWETFGRDSLDGQGMPLVSYVSYDRNYNNAFWNGRSMTYGDGDGINFRPLSLDVDVVAHELTHGLTGSTSGLIYTDESGALNEAMSDIFGAMVDQKEGATGDDIWLVGEDIYTPGIPGDALRNMANPTATNDRDYYPERYFGSADNGGVHINSGIANLAFMLLVMGGRHPRGKTSTTVEGIGFEAAAAIFYWANVDCLTPRATFEMARFCTAETFGGQHKLNVHQAWDAVGVPGGPPPPPVLLQDGVPLGGQNGGNSDKREYRMEPINAGDTVTCSFRASSGDPDLYLRFGEEPNAWPNWRDNACSSYTPTAQESCTTPPAESSTTLFVLVHAWDSQQYNDLTITCTIDRPNTTPTEMPRATLPTNPTTTAPTNAPSTNAECCSDFEDESACNEARIGDGFASYGCKWCRLWFGFGDQACTPAANVFCQ